MWDFEDLDDDEMDDFIVFLRVKH